MSVLPQPRPSSALPHATHLASNFAYEHEPIPSRETVYFERHLGDSELSYYLPSRANGVNDMYLHIGFRAPQELVQRDRVSIVWAILRTRHPLLASSIHMHSYEDVRFVYLASMTATDALDDANSNLEFSAERKDELLDGYLNGPRTLSNEKLSKLVISQPKLGSEQLPPEATQFEFMLCAAHFIGDGMALHNSATMFFELLGGNHDQNKLHRILQDEIQSRREAFLQNINPIPPAMEARFQPDTGGNLKFRQVISKVDFDVSQSRLIGGHSFPKVKGKARRTVVPTICWSREKSKKILEVAKQHKVSVSSAIFALLNISWARVNKYSNWTMPTMMYSALNLRPNLAAVENTSFWYLAVGYFNVILPSFLPQSRPVSHTFWHRAKIAQEQTRKAAKHPKIVSRSREMAKLRGHRARQWAEEDDNRERGLPPPPPLQNTSTLENSPQTPSDALVGLSLLGNLDGTYQHASFPEIELHTLTTGSRQRSQSSLLFSYTFAGKLWLCFGYDENGYDKEVIERFWSKVVDGVDEFFQ